MLSFNIIKDYKVVEKKIIFQLDYEWSLKIIFFEDNIIKISFKPNKEKNLENIDPQELGIGIKKRIKLAIIN